MLKRLLLASVLMAATGAAASAAPIVGSFSFQGFGGTFIGGAGTALTATGLDFGEASSEAGNGYGVAGSALVGNAHGSFSAFNGTTATIADISLGATANPYLDNPFISFGGSAIVLNFNDAAITRSTTGTSVTVAGLASYSDGNPADASTGMFSLSANSQQGSPASVTFTFTGNASATPIPEPVSMSLLGAGLIGLGVIRLRRKS